MGRGNTNIAIDLWFGNGKRNHKKKEMDPFHQMRNMTGGRMLQPNLRAAPIVYALTLNITLTLTLTLAPALTLAQA